MFLQIVGIYTSALKTGAVCYSETSIPTYKSTQRHNIDIFTAARTSDFI
jgi:hypothetical protein